MKNKTKKILAGACLGLVGMGLMTGCSMSLSEEQVNKLMTVVDSSDTFMEETIDLLQESNKKMDRETAHMFYQYSVNRLKLNYNNVWDNLRIEFSLNGAEGLSTGNVDFFKMSNGKNVMYYDHTQDGERHLWNYHDSTEVAQPPKTEENGDWTTYYPATGSFEYYAYNAVIVADSEECVTVVDFDLEDIVDCQVLENGNYLLNVTMDDVSSKIGNEFAREFVGNFEISEEGYLIGVEYMFKTIRPISGMQDSMQEGSPNYKFTHLKAKYNYGVLTESEVQANIDAYFAQED